MRAGVELLRAQSAQAAFEVALPPAPTGGELAHAFAALSVACRLFAREAASLTDEWIAGEYLKSQGWPQ